MLVFLLQKYPITMCYEKRKQHLQKGDNLILKTNSNKSAKSSPAIKCMPKSDKIILCNYYFFFIQCSNILILISQPNSEDMMILNNLHDYDGTQF